MKYVALISRVPDRSQNVLKLTLHNALRTTLRPLLTVGAFALGLSLSSCGSAPGAGDLVTGTQLRTYLSGTDLVAEMRSQLNTGNLMIAGLDVPIYDKKDPSRVLGHIAINNSFCGKLICSASELVLSVNLSLASKGASVVNTLPNGTAIPIGGLAGTPIIGIPVKDNAQLYVGISDTVALMGLALPFDEMDGLGSSIPGVNLFQPFGDSSVQGIAGIFTGSKPGQSGIALFVDLSSVIHSSAQGASSVSGVATERAAMLRSSASLSGAEREGVALAPNARPLNLREVKPGKRTERRLLMGISQLNSEGGSLTVR